MSSKVESKPGQSVILWPNGKWAANRSGVQELTDPRKGRDWLWTAIKYPLRLDAGSEGGKVRYQLYAAHRYQRSSPDRAFRREGIKYSVLEPPRSCRLGIRRRTTGICESSRVGSCRFGRGDFCQSLYDHIDLPAGGTPSSSTECLLLSPIPLLVRNRSGESLQRHDLLPGDMPES